MNRTRDFIALPGHARHDDQARERPSWHRRGMQDAREGRGFPVDYDGASCEQQSAYENGRLFMARTMAQARI